MKLTGTSSCPLAQGNIGKPKPSYNNSLATQRTRLLEYFSKCPRLTTMQAREEGILHPSGRIMELRRSGYKIDTHWIKAPDSNGVLHRIGLYVFQGRKSGVNYES